MISHLSFFMLSLGNHFRAYAQHSKAIANSKPDICNCQEIISDDHWSLNSKA